MDIETEIKKESTRIQAKTVEYETKVEDLEGKIKSFTNWAWGFVYGGFLIALVGLILFLIQSTTAFQLNVLGDFYGGSVASIWSLAGLFFIYVAFLGQKQQLLNQQTEIMYSQLEVKFTRLELQGQKKEMIAQNLTLSQQRFENTFFQLLSLFNSIVNSLDLKKPHSNNNEVIATGRDCFEIFYKRLTHMITNVHSQSNQIKPEKATIDETLKAYSVLYDSNKSDMSHYFRTLYHIIKFVDNSDIHNKNQYTSIVRAQLSSYEQIIIFYNCLHMNGNEKFKPLIEAYAIFKNIDSSLVHNPDHLNLYKNTAYGNN